MKRNGSAILIAFLSSSVLISPALACRYNVRETGFVDLGSEPYILCGYIDANTPPEVADGFKGLPDAALAESNVVFRLIDVDREKGHPALEYLDPNCQSIPCAVLVSPDGQTMPVSVSKPGEPFEKTFGSAVERILSSPKRSEILRRVSRMYGVVVVIEGPDPDANEMAKKGGAAAVEQVASQMELMPKEIGGPPVMMVMDSNCLADEEVLLWSLGLKPSDVNEPLAVIIYGKARWIGPVFRGEQVNEDDLASVLFVIGADCECGLDYRWIQGTMLPARWDEKTHALAVESLGFDPESPMIKMEIGSIIGRGMGGNAYPGTPYGYQELIIEPATDSDELPSENSPRAVAATSRQVSRQDVVEVAIEEGNDVSAVEAPADASIAAKNVYASVEEPNRGTPDPNAIRAILDEERRQESAEAAGGDDIHASMRSLALLTIGLFVFVAIFGVAILARARRA
ncbi:MAG: hypothetical protein JXN61_14175 [Sedimentisphaerales bacterium]|nr:hypothetical protein [Sedimentisphaerales bacterium]